MPKSKWGRSPRKKDQEARNQSLFEWSVGRVPPQAGLTTGSAVRVRAGEPNFTGRDNIPAFLIMPYWVYIIQSQSTSRYYCGYSDNVERRVNQHNDPEYRGSRTTKVFQGPWNIIWTKECPNRSEAVALERKIKKRGISRYLNDRSAESRHRRD